MSSSLAPADSTLIKVCVEAVAYGMSFVLSWQAITSLVARARKGSHRVLLCGLIIMMVLAALHATSNIQYLRQGFITSQTNPDNYYTSVKTPAWGIEYAVRITVIIVANFLAIWRLFYAWQWSRLMVLFPFLSLLGSIGAIAGYTVRHQSEPANSLLKPSPAEFRFTVAFFSCAFFTCLYTTTFVIYKLFQLDKQDEINLRYEETPRWIAHVLIESDALYTVTLGAYLVLHAIGSPGEQLLAAWVVPIAVISISVIILWAEKLTAHHAQMEVLSELNESKSSGSSVNAEPAMIGTTVLVPDYTSRRRSWDSVSVWSKPSAKVSTARGTSIGHGHHHGHHLHPDQHSRRYRGY